MADDAIGAGLDQFVIRVQAGVDAPIRITQDATLAVSRIEGETAVYEFLPHRYGFLFVADGKIEAKKVVLTRTAHMSGDVIHQDIRIESGAFIDGHCRPEFGKTESRSSASKSLGVTVQPEKPNGAGAKI